MRGPRFGRAVLATLALATPWAARAQSASGGQGAPLQVLRPHPGFTVPSDLPPAVALANAARGLAQVYGGAPISVTTYHNDNNRTGWNASETDLTPASVASSSFGLLTTLTVDGSVMAQPLLVSGATMADGSVHTVLVIATMHNSVYAFDAQTYAILWQVNMGPSQSSVDVGCSDVTPELGIASTPVIEPGLPGQLIIYLVSATEASPMVFQSQVHALDLASGLDTQTVAVISPSATLSTGATVAFEAQDQWSRAGLAFNNGSLYVGIGSHCDNDEKVISGWLLRYDTTLTLKSTFNTIHSPAKVWLASVWMSGSAPAIDGAGDVFVVTGNGFYTGQTGQDWGQSVLMLAPDLSAVTTSFTPSAWAQLNSGDHDLGSGGVMLAPPVVGQAAPPLALVMGKPGLLYLLDQTSLGGDQPNDVGALQAVHVPTSPTGLGLWGAPAYFDGPGGPTIYVQTASDVLKAYSLSTGASPSMSLVAQGTSKGGPFGSMPVVSSNGVTANTGVVWDVKRTSPPQLEAYNAATLGKPLFHSNAGRWPNHGIFLSPLVANGRVYVGSQQEVMVFGLAD